MFVSLQSLWVMFILFYIRNKFVSYYFTMSVTTWFVCYYFLWYISFISSVHALFSDIAFVSRYLFYVTLLLYAKWQIYFYLKSPSYVLFVVATSDKIYIYFLLIHPLFTWSRKSNSWVNLHEMWNSLLWTWIEMTLS